MKRAILLTLGSLTFMLFANDFWFDFKTIDKGTSNLIDSLYEQKLKYSDTNKSQQAQKKLEAYLKKKKGNTTKAR